MVNIVAYWPENDPFFRFFTKRVEEIRKNWKITSFERLKEDIEKYDRLYLPLNDWGEADIYIYPKIVKALNLKEINVVFVRKGGRGVPIEFGALYYTSRILKVPVKKERSGLKNLKVLSTRNIPLRLF